MRRLSAEEVRDAILSASGRLVEEPFGPADEVNIRKDGLVTAKANRGGWRRSVYVRQRRKEMPSILETFDLPQMNPNCTQRMDSTVVSQPLYLLNNKMIYDLSRSFAERVEREAGDSMESRIALTYQLALGTSIDDQQQQITRRQSGCPTSSLRASPAAIRRTF